MKHKIIYGSVGLVIASVAVAVPLAVTLTDTSDDLTIEERRAAELEADRDRIQELLNDKDDEVTANANRLTELNSQLEESNRKLQEEQQKAAQAVADARTAAQSANTEIQNVFNAEDVFRSFLDEPAQASIKAAQTIILNNYISAWNEWFLATDKSVAQAKITAEFAKFDASVSTQANALKTAFEALSTASDDIKDAYVVYVNDINAANVALVLEQQRAAGLQTQINQVNDELTAAKQQRDDFNRLLQAKTQELEDLQEEVASLDVVKKQIDFWFAHGGKFEGFVPGNVSYQQMVDGQTLPDGQFPSDFEIPWFMDEIEDHAFEGATLPEGFELPNTVKTLGINSFKNASLPSTFTLPHSIETFKVDETKGEQDSSKYVFSDVKFRPAGTTDRTQTSTLETTDYYTWAMISDNWMYNGIQNSYKVTRPTTINLDGFSYLPSYLFVGPNNQPMTIDAATLHFPSTLKKIEAHAFEGATITNPQAFVLPASLREVEPGAFHKVKGLAYYNQFAQSYEIKAQSLITDLNTILWINHSAVNPTDGTKGTITHETVHEQYTTTEYYSGQYSPMYWFDEDDQHNKMLDPFILQGGNQIDLSQASSWTNVQYIPSYAFPSVPSTLNLPSSIIGVERNAFKPFDAYMHTFNLNAIMWINASMYDETTRSLNPAFVSMGSPMDWGDLSMYINFGPGGPNPADLQLSQVTRIPDGAFIGCQLPTGFTLPSTVKIIGKDAFKGARIPDGFTLPSSVEVIEDGAFEGASVTNDFQNNMMSRNISYDSMSNHWIVR